MDVVIIGAGLAGLTAAAVLHKAGADVQVVEADAQIGGRIRAQRDPATKRVVADLGPTWVWPKYQPVVARWISALGLLTYEQFNDGNAVILGYQPAPLLRPLPGQDGMVRIQGGPSAFVDALSGQLGAARIRTAAPAAGISANGTGHVTVRLASGEIISARQAIVSIPLRVAASTLDMGWAPKALWETMRQTPTWMSTHAKAVALYDRPFWREAGLSGRIASQTGPLVEAHDHCGIDGLPAAIFGFVGWAPELRQKDPTGLKQAILEQLSECFGHPAAQPNALIVQDWASNPYIVTQLDLAGSATHPDVGPAILRQPFLDGRVHFAVSETSDISPGLIEGALSAGERAAKAALRGLELNLPGKKK